jgi:eukaryotic-like serine/threonine-protein kinase
MISSGTRLGPYEVADALGAGGMGEVYRGRDTRLDRPVAIKVLPPHLASNPDFKLRFEREARVISSLNHPNICTLHDVGEQEGVGYLVMELCEGESLADRLLRGPLPTEQLLQYGIQIADALDRAHRSGVVHRDLKPGNIMLTKAGAKLLDFGLAKPALLAGSSSNPPVSAQPAHPSIFEGATQQKPLTAEGSIVGTFQYMAPEQFEGLEADARSDIFAFGCVLYEMATGKRPFEGKTKASLIASILEREPQPISETRPLTPPALQRVISTSMAKDPDDRWQSAHDILLELRWISEAGSQAGVAAPLAMKRKNRERLAWSLAAIAAAAAIGAAAMLYRATSGAAPLALNIAPNTGTSFNFGGEAIGALAMSPDGRSVVFPLKDAAGKTSLWLRDIGQPAARLLPGTEDGVWPFWSPDNRHVAFFAGGKLKKVAIGGGNPTVLCPVQNNPRPGSWNKEGTIIFSPSSLTSIYKIQASGGKPVSVTALAEGETTHRWATFLPDGRHFIYLTGTHVNTESETNAVYVSSLDGMKPKLLLRTRSNAAYAAGHLLYVEQGNLMARRMNLKRLEVEDNAVPIAGGVFHSSSFFLGGFSVAGNRSLVYRAGSTDELVQISWFDRSGRNLGKVGEPTPWGAMALAPDGQSFVAEVHEDSGSSDLWLYDLERNIRTRFTFRPLSEFAPVWSRDGSHIVYSGIAMEQGQGQVWDLYIKPSTGGGAEQILYASEHNKTPTDWSPDGRYLAFTYWDLQRQKSAISLLPLQGEKKPIPFLPSEFSMAGLAFSPDGKWVLYLSDESGKREAYVAPFPGPGGKWQVSNGGAAFAAWRKGGSEIIYGSGASIRAVDIGLAGESLRIGAARLLFENAAVSSGDVSADGERFLLAHQLADAPQDTVTILTDWTAALKK